MTAKRWWHPGVALAIVLLATALWPAAARAQEYRVGPGDRLLVSVYDRPALSGVVEVRDDGSLPLHLLGEVNVDGLTLSEIEARIVDHAADRFSGQISVLVGIDAYRPIYVLGAVEAPGPYPFRPGLTVIKAIAQAGGHERQDEEADEPNVVDGARRRVLMAQSELAVAEAELSAIEAELARLTGGGEVPETGTGDEHSRLIQLRRDLLARSIEGSERQIQLATEEAELYTKRRELIARQLSNTQTQLERIEDLVSRGLARREQFLDLQVDADEFRSDELEAAAFEAQARQTAVTAESEIEVARVEYHQGLLADKVELMAKMDLARADLQASLDTLRTAAPAAIQDLGDEYAPVYEVYRDGEDGPPRTVGLRTALSPDDVLMVRFVTVTQ